MLTYPPPYDLCVRIGYGYPGVYTAGRVYRVCFTHYLHSLLKYPPIYLFMYTYMSSIANTIMRVAVTIALLLGKYWSYYESRSTNKNRTCQIEVFIYE